MGLAQPFLNQDHCDRLQRAWEAIFSGSDADVEVHEEDAPAGSRRTYPRRLLEDQVSQLVEQYLSGRTADQLAEDWDIHRTTVLEHLKRRNIPRRKGKIVPEQVPVLVEAYQAGATLAALGRHLEVDPTTVRRALLQAGVRIRGRGRPPEPDEGS